MQDTLKALVIFEQQALMTFITNNQSQTFDATEERLKRMEYQ